jgi:alkylhydroperoxidase/carboxymuconolactone decarboxylase family protein YurZ
MNAAQKPPVEEIFGMMQKMMGAVPSSIEKAAKVDEGLLYEHLRSRQYAMPPEGALDEETRTLLYLASALAAGSAACIQAMANKAKTQGIPAAKIMETVHIVRFALATKAIGEAEPVFEALQALPK